MPDRCPALLVRILIGAALLLPFATQAQLESWYQVELIVFSYPAGGAAEQWEATPGLAYPDGTRFLTKAGELPAAGQRTAFAMLPATQREFGGKVDSMQRSGRYQILFHEAWLQPMTSQAGAVPIVLDRSGDGGKWPALQGTINLYMSSDLHLETNLWLNTQGDYLHSSWRMPPPPLGPSSLQSLSPTQSKSPDVEYPYRHAILLQQTRRMSSGEVNYIDHPMLGVVAKITALDGTAPEPTAQPETTVQPATTVSPEAESDPNPPT